MTLGTKGAAFVLVAASVLAAPSLRAQEDVDLLIRNVTVIDGTGSAGRPGMDVLIRGGLIASVEATSADTTFDGRVVDGSGRFLIPGIIDAHVHLSTTRHEDVEPLLNWIVQGGVTTVRDMAGDARALAGMQRAVLLRELMGPSIYYSALMAGPAFMSDPRLLAATVGYDDGQAPYMVALTEETDLDLAMAMARGAGATGIKLYAALDASLVRAATEAAHRAGLEVWAHSAIFPAKPTEILDAGVDGVSHAPYVIWEAAPRSDDFTQRGRGDFAGVPPSGEHMDQVIGAMLRNGTVLDATLLVWKLNDERNGTPLRLGWAAEFTRRAHDAGVPIAAGTDGVGRPLAGELPAVHEEMAVLVDEAGLTPLQALVAGTMGSARAIGIEERVGSIQPGKVADLVLLAADPTMDIRNTRRIVHVIKQGRIVR